MALIGLINENEFYSDHYLAEIFAGDIRGVLETWQGKETQAREAQRERAASLGEKPGRYDGYLTPVNRLNGLAQDWLARQQEAERRRGSERIIAQRAATRRLLETFELPSRARRLALSDDDSCAGNSPAAGELPLLGELNDAQGNPLLWILEAQPGSQEEPDLDPLACHLQPDQLLTLSDAPLSPELAKASKERGSEEETLDWHQRLSRQVFSQEKPPRWVLLCGARQWLLLDRAKFAQRRLLRFDWPELFARREMESLKAVSVLLHGESLLGSGGTALLDSLDENAHKHAYGVSEDLKYALRECIELLGDEASSQLEARAQAHKKSIYTGRDALDPGQLSLQCLRYMYRLLFLFYIEARPELGYAPVGSATYLKGYSLEHLRELELVPLTSEAERNGRYFNDTLTTLFRLIHSGYQPTEPDMLAEYSGKSGRQTGRDAFRMTPLRSHLFDPERMALLKHVVFPNHLLQRVIQLMSLSRPAGSGRGSRRRRGRISYAQLGINQLGAVYEALLSYRGFFARETLYEVKPKGESWDPLGTGYFVPAEALDDYSDDEKVFIKDPASEENRLLAHPKGSFLYRLAGRDRQKSASYYTPEVLTRSLVKYALKELYEEQLDPLPDDAARAQRLLQLTVCEPAMGSAAFLNEAISQLADKYLQLAQSAAPGGQRIPQADYAAEKQKVKMYLADNNVFGVDLNPVAVELAEVSLWLGALSSDRFVPWFGLQLHCGNSLIGARRETFSTAQLSHNGEGSWLKSAPKRFPLRLPHSGEGAAENAPGQGAEGDGRIWHFLLPDTGMADYTDRAVKALYPEAIKRINAWRRQFTRPFAKDDIVRLERLSARINELWAEHAKSLGRLRQRTTDPYAIYGRPASGQATDIAYKDAVLDQELLARDLDNTGAYRRLKLAMDYWCALWFWPIAEAEALPDRDEWLMDLENLLLGDTIATQRPGQALSLFADTNPEEGKRFVDRFGVVDFTQLFAAFPRLAMANRIATQRRFFHWELAFADVFAQNGGFDLTLGNPPWLKVEWSSGDVLGDYEPRFVIRKLSATKLNALRDETFERIPALKQGWTDEYEECVGTQAFLNAVSNYPELKGVQTNLYKCFLPRAWANSSEKGVAGFLHPEGVYDDPKGGGFRRELYPRLRAHFQFINETKLFAEVHNQTLFSINVHGPESTPRFAHVSNLFVPATLDTSYAHDGEGEVPGIKEEVEQPDGRLKVKWNFEGHRDRILYIGEKELTLFAQLYDTAGTDALEARLPALHARQLIAVLEKFAAQPKRLGDLQGEYFSTVMFDETYAQRDGTIKRETRFPDSAEEWVLSGPHFFVGNPLFKSPRPGCKSNKDYDNLDLERLPDDYLPRTNYVPACDPDTYRARTPKVPWIDGGESQPKRVTAYYRLTSRTMIGSSSERTLQSAIIAKGPAHLDLGFTVLPKDQDLLVGLAVSYFSVVFDFFVKSTGKGHFRNDISA